MAQEQARARGGQIRFRSSIPSFLLLQFLRQNDASAPFYHPSSLCRHTTCRLHSERTVPAGKSLLGIPFIGFAVIYPNARPETESDLAVIATASVNLEGQVSTRDALHCTPFSPTETIQAPRGRQAAAIHLVPVLDHHGSGNLSRGGKNLDQGRKTLWATAPALAKSCTHYSDAVAKDRRYTRICIWHLKISSTCALDLRRPMRCRRSPMRAVCPRTGSLPPLIRSHIFTSGVEVSLQRLTLPSTH